MHKVLDRLGNALVLDFTLFYWNRRSSEHVLKVADFESEVTSNCSVLGYGQVDEPEENFVCMLKWRLWYLFLAVKLNGSKSMSQ